ncbi:bZIP transcription factor 1 [Phytophthora citrophthora]|uniref:BZIP transcription factor 1 n=1 Tax=Phytophthora citrophthora TaxID=4793 RepID=A0AAD9GQ62_9STRA|nr:bZIP transcription factor 1 [Phytophthora citrophthora]
MASGFPSSVCFSDESISTVAQHGRFVYDQHNFNAGRDNETNTVSCTDPSCDSQQLKELLGLKCTRGTSGAKNIQEAKKIIQDIILKRNIHRERCRINQARYRSKQREYLACISAEVEQLRNEIQTLEKHRQATSFGVPTKNSVWDIATEYFRLFRHGYITPVAFARSRQSHLQLEFLQETMSIDVVNGGVWGVNAHLESWRLFSLYHDNVHLELESLEKGPENSIIATTKTGVTITENTLRNLYRHLLVNESDDTKWSPLAHRMLDQRIEMDGSIHFVCDPTTGRVTSLQTTTNLLAPILRLVGSIEDLARVFDGAFITPDGKVLFNR